MTNEQVIVAFLQKKKAQTPKRRIDSYCYVGDCTLKTDGNVLINYRTIIAKHENNILKINKSKYSQTTSKIQSKLSYLATIQGFEIVEVDGQELN